MELYTNELKKRFSRNNELEREHIMLDDEFLKAGLSESTARTYDYWINRYLEWLEDRDITIENAEIFLLEGRKKEVSANGLATIKSAINFYFDIVLDEGKVEFKIGRIKRKLPIILTKLEIKSWLNYYSHNSDIDTRILLEIFLSSGIRVDEFFNLRYNDFDLDNFTLKINGAKGDKERTTVISQELVKDLKFRYSKETLESNKLIARFSRIGFSQALKRWAKKAGIRKNVYPHLLRHCFGTYHYKQFKDIVLLSKLMGHESIEMTKVYITLSGEDIKGAESPNYN